MVICKRTVLGVEKDGCWAVGSERVHVRTVVVGPLCDTTPTVFFAALVRRSDYLRMMTTSQPIMPPSSIRRSPSLQPSVPPVAAPPISHAPLDPQSQHPIIQS
jgi:hypothetical protein